MRLNLENWSSIRKKKYLAKTQSLQCTNNSDSRKHAKICIIIGQ